MTWEDLIFQGAVHPMLEPVLRGLVRSKESVIVSGATGSGKTTLLATLLADVDHRERIVLIEEAGEVRPSHPHVVRLVERPANVDGAGAVGMSRLVREALRMRPDRIVLGECRGAEIREVLLALNTGHRGSLTTLHANAAADVPARLIALGALAGLSERGIRRDRASGEGLPEAQGRGGRIVAVEGRRIDGGSGGDRRCRRALPSRRRVDKAAADRAAGRRTSRGGVVRQAS